MQRMPLLRMAVRWLARTNFAIHGVEGNPVFFAALASRPPPPARCNTARRAARRTGPLEATRAVERPRGGGGGGGDTLLLLGHVGDILTNKKKKIARLVWHQPGLYPADLCRIRRACLHLTPN